MTGLPLIIVFVLAIVVMIVAISKYKIHPFLSIMSVSLILALLEVFFAVEGSLQRAAQRLFIHKNTMQYRLKRLAEDTGLDVRKPSQAPSLYLAMLLYLDLSRGDDDLGF